MTQPHLHHDFTLSLSHYHITPSQHGWRSTPPFHFMTHTSVSRVFQSSTHLVDSSTWRCVRHFTIASLAATPSALPPSSNNLKRQPCSHSIYITRLVLSPPSSNSLLTLSVNLQSAPEPPSSTSMSATTTLMLYKSRATSFLLLQDCRFDKSRHTPSSIPFASARSSVVSQLNIGLCGLWFVGPSARR